MGRVFCKDKPYPVPISCPRELSLPDQALWSNSKIPAMQKLTRLLLVLWLLAAAGCGKDDFYQVTGQLTDPNLGVPVSGAMVSVWTQKIESGIFAANYKLVGELVTGQDGEFAIELDNATYTGVRLVFSKNGYFGWETELNTAELVKDDPYYKVFQMLPKGWIRIHIINTEPFDDDDFFEYRLLNAYTGCEECCPSGPRQFTGMAIDQVAECISAGHQDLLIQWSKRKNNEQDVKSMTFFVTAFDTTRIELIY
jgi:hypothetical protein